MHNGAERSGFFFVLQLMSAGHTPHSPASTTAFSRILRLRVLNAVIILLAVVVGFLSYSLIRRHVIAPPVETTGSGTSEGGVIQINVLNGCGVDGAASRCTTFLRDRGYDVVEIRNYKTFDVDESLVIDRTGNLTTAEKVAYALGIRKTNVIQELNPDYYVDVSVVVGRDFSSLKPSR